MLQNNDHTTLTAAEKLAAQALDAFIAKALGDVPFVMSCLPCGDLDEKCLLLDLPVRAEDGEKISPLYLTIKRDGTFYLEYFQNAACISNERGCIAANEINFALKDLPTTCAYSRQEQGFYISSVFYDPKRVVGAIGSVLLALEYIILLESYLTGKASEAEEEAAFDAVAAGGSHVNPSQFEPFNIAH